MSPRQAGRAAVVCTLILGVVTAAAQPARRPVAVIELSNSAENRRFAADIANELITNADLRPIDSFELISVLYGPIRDEHAELLANASREKQAAEEAIGAYNFPEAAKSADAALAYLERAGPAPRVTALYAEIAFLLGVARLGERKQDKADDAFRLTHRVNASFKPDAIRYLPEVVQAYDRALKTMSAATGKLDIALSGRVFVDGEEVGTGPAWFDVTAGAHVVWVTDPEREPRAKRVTIVPGQKERPAIEDKKTPLELKVERARLALKTAPDASARAAAMNQLASLLEIKDAVLLTSVNGRTIVQTWSLTSQKAPGFSPLRERGKDEKPIDVLKPLLPEKVVVIPPKPEDGNKKPIIPVDPRSWYEKPRYQIGGGVAAAIVLIVGVVLYKTWDRTIGVNDDPGFVTRPAP